jgi:hypothetical protein
MARFARRYAQDLVRSAIGVADGSWRFGTDVGHGVLCGAWTREQLGNILQVVKAGVMRGRCTKLTRGLATSDIFRAVSPPAPPFSDHRRRPTATPGKFRTQGSLLGVRFPPP